MFNFDPKPGAEGKLIDKPTGRVIGFLQAFKKRRKRGNKTRSQTRVFFLTPEEYEAQKHRKH